MPTLDAQIAQHAEYLLRSGAVSSPAEAQRRARAHFASCLAELSDDLNKVLPGGAGGPL